MIILMEYYFGALMLWTSAYFVGKILLDYDKRNDYLKVLVTIFIASLLLEIINIINLGPLYGIIKVAFVYTLQCFFFKIIFNQSLQKTILISLVFYLFLFLSEVIIAMLLSFILSTLVETLGFLKNSILINFLVSLFTFLHIVLFKRLLSQFFINNKNEESLNNIIVAVMLLTVALLLFRIPVEKWKLSIEFIATMSILLGFCIIGIYLIKQRSDIQKTSLMYQHVVKYSNTTNKVLEDYRMISHEHKNQLSIIRQMVPKNNKELIEYLDNLMNKYSDIKYKWVSELNKLPSEGLKGLINYKLIEMDDNGIKSTVTISKEVSKIRLNKLNTTQKDHLYSICGVYLDNAIQAAIKGKEKEIAIDIYKENKDLVFVIANTYKGKIELGKIDDYGYSTKGKNHGIGLHLVKTILDEDKLFSQERKIIDKYYVQELRLHISELNNNKHKK